MEYVLTPHAKERNPYCWFENVFSEEELNFLQNKAFSASQEATVGKNKNNNSNIRRSELSWLKNDSDFNWLFERLGGVVSNANARFFNFDLTGFGEAIQLTNYRSDVKGTYDWHQDFGGVGPSRKLSLVLQLTDPSQYEGGNLELLYGQQPHQIRKQRGYLVLFPSWALHRVTPVTQGTRQSLVAWVSGPEFK